MKNTVLRYTLMGIVFGFLFPFFGTVLEIITKFDSMFTLQNLNQAQSGQPQLWIIDTAPIFLGLFAYFIGQNRQRYMQANQSLLEEQTDRANILQEELDKQKEQLETTISQEMVLTERRAQYLQATADIGRAAASIYSMEELLPQVVNMISERFGYYQVGIFLIDEYNDFAELKAASSPGGKQMLARQHKLRVGEEGIVGYVTNTGEPRIALDVGQEAVYFDTPELPETRSELALPLFVGGKLMGALDVQSLEPAAFTDDDILTLGVLADQVSMAISNATLFEQLQNSVETARRARGELNRQAWLELLKLRENWGYRYAKKSISQVSEDWSADMEDAISDSQVIKGDASDLSLTIPISLYDTNIGAIRVSKPAGSIPWTDDETDLVQSLGEGLSQALESARLYHETRQRAAQEYITTDIAANVRRTLDIDSVLRTAAEELGKVFDAQEVVIRMNTEQS